MIELDPKLQAALEAAVSPTCDGGVGPDNTVRHGIPAVFVFRSLCAHQHQGTAMLCGDCEADMTHAALFCPVCLSHGHLCPITERSSERIVP